MTIFDNVDFWLATCHGLLFSLVFSMQCFNGQRDALTAADAWRYKAARILAASPREAPSKHFLNHFQGDLCILRVQTPRESATQRFGIMPLSCLSAP
jgi:hypothetical protein